MDPPYRVPATPGTPLFPISPERANKQPLNHAVPNSPSAPPLPFHSHSRTSSDVQVKVEKFNSLTKEVSERRRANEAALKRAVVGREEAENETRRTKDELKKLKFELSEGKVRERKVGERLDSVLEELHRAKETHKHSITLYEKEVRRARKEAFKYSSSFVKLQEDLKATRISLRNAHHEIEGGRNKTEKREQEAFAARYELIGVQEELAKMKERVEVVEQERDALKTNLKEEEVARIAAEGRLSLPSPTEDEIRESSPQKETRPLTPVVTVIGDDANELAAVKEELGFAKTRAIKAEEMVDFMRMECQFRCCSCRVTEWYDKGYVHDDTLASAMDRIQQERDRTLSSTDSDQASPQGTAENHISGEPTSEQSQQQQQQPPVSGTHQNEDDFIPPTDAPGYTLPAEGIQINETLRPGENVEPDPVPLCRLEKSHSDPTAMTLNSDTSLLSLLNAPHSQPAFQPPHPEARTHATPSSPGGLSTPSTVATRAPLNHHPPTEILDTPPTTTATTIPLQGTAAEAAPILSPATMSREEALEQIRRRRGRTKSIAAMGTPKSKMPRRDISAPAK